MARRQAADNDLTFSANPFADGVPGISGGGGGVILGERLDQKVLIGPGERLLVPSPSRVNRPIVDVANWEPEEVRARKPPPPPLVAAAPSGALA